MSNLPLLRSLSSCTCLSQVKGVIQILALVALAPLEAIIQPLVSMDLTRLHLYDRSFRSILTQIW